MLAKSIGFIGIIAAIVLLFFIFSTTPSSAGPVGILSVFVCFYVLMLCLTTVLLWVIHRVIRLTAKPFIARKPIEPLKLSTAYYFSSILALGPVILIGMQSVGEVGIYELGLIILFVSIGCVYIAKRIA